VPRPATCVGCADTYARRVLPRFEIVHRVRPMALVASERRSGFMAPFVAVEAALPDPAAPATCVVAGADGVHLAAVWDGRAVRLEVTDAAGRTTRHVSRRHGRPEATPDGLALTLTGSELCALTREEGGWRVRSRVDVRPAVDPRDPDLLATLEAYADGVDDWRAGDFGRLGLRDPKLVAHADGRPVERDGRLFLALTHAGPGFGDTGHCGIWSWDPATGSLAPTARLFFRRGGRVLGDHATHVVRDGDRWLVATSTWGDFDRTSVDITLAATTDDVLAGDHVLDATPLGLPRPAPTVAVWDPHLAVVDGHWHVAYVAARRFFDFRPVLARADRPGRLDGWTLLGVADDRRATEGTSLVRVDGSWRVLASDGPDNPRGLRRRYPVFDLGLREIGVLDAPYPSNIPWPTVVEHDGRWHLVTFDGTPCGGRLAGYGTHGDLLLMCSREAPEGA